MTAPSPMALVPKTGDPTGIDAWPGVILQRHRAAPALSLAIPAIAHRFDGPRDFEILPVSQRILARNQGSWDGGHPQLAPTWGGHQGYPALVPARLPTVSAS